MDDATAVYRLSAEERLALALEALSLDAAHYDFCPVHKTIETTPAVAQRLTDHVWPMGELLDGALAATPPTPTVTAPERRRRFRVIQGQTS